MNTGYTFDGIHLYVDDVLLMSSPELIDQHKRVLIRTLCRLGFVINWDKSCIDSQTSMIYIGHVLSSHGPEGIPEILVTKAKVRKFWKDIRRALQLGHIKGENWQE